MQAAWGGRSSAVQPVGASPLPDSLVWLWYIQTRVDGSLGPGPELSGTCTQCKRGGGRGGGGGRSLLWGRGSGRAEAKEAAQHTDSCRIGGALHTQHPQQQAAHLQQNCSSGGGSNSRSGGGRQRARVPARCRCRWCQAGRSRLPCLPPSCHRSKVSPRSSSGRPRRGGASWLQSHRWEGRVRTEAGQAGRRARRRKGEVRGEGGKEGGRGGTHRA